MDKRNSASSFYERPLTAGQRAATKWVLLSRLIHPMFSPQA